MFQFQRSLRMTSIDFISQIGGLLGLFLGFSLISGIEIVYWFTLRLCHRIVGNKSRRCIEMFQLLKRFSCFLCFSSTAPAKNSFNVGERNTSLASHLSTESGHSTKVIVQWNDVPNNLSPSHSQLTSCQLIYYFYRKTKQNKAKSCTFVHS